MLFCFRGRRVPPRYLNKTLIPALCQKAGVPREDARGRITSHRARTTIATQLYNAKEPMTLFELQAWLGHRSPLSTQYYAKILPTTLARAYADAGYFARNVRTIEVLVDRESVQNGTAQWISVAVLRSWPWLLHLQLLRTMPAPHGLRALRLLLAEGFGESSTSGGARQSATDAGADSTYR